jgi:transposase InsO family protein
MSNPIHGRARTTPLTRQEIKDSTLPQHVLAKLYNVSRQTIRKWQQRESVTDASHRPHTLLTTLSPVQEAIVVELRQTLRLPLDDLTAVVHQFINAAASRAGIHRCLKRHGIADLRAMQCALNDDAPVQEGHKPKTFKDYEPGFLHMDIKYLPQMPDETARRYLFVAIDRATRWVHMHIYANQNEKSSTDFLRRVQRQCPVKIQKLLTDNGSQFTDRFRRSDKRASGQHAFDIECQRLDIEHRLSPPRHPQTNGMVERFNGRISEVVKQTRFASAAELETTLKHYLNIYNHHIPQQALGHQSPVDAMKAWQVKKPELFIKRVYKQTGLDSYVFMVGKIERMQLKLED